MPSPSYVLIAQLFMQSEAATYLCFLPQTCLIYLLFFVLLHLDCFSVVEDQFMQGQILCRI